MIFVDAEIAELDIGGGVVEVADGEGEGFGDAEAVIIFSGDFEGDGAGADGLAAFHFQDAVDDFKAFVVDENEAAVVDIRIDHLDPADQSAGAVVDDEAAESDVGGGFVDIDDIDIEALGADEAVVGFCRDAEEDGVAGFGIEGYTGFELELAAGDFEAVVRKGVASDVAAIVEGEDETADDAAGEIFADCVGAETEVDGVGAVFDDEGEAFAKAGAMLVFCSDEHGGIIAEGERVSLFELELAEGDFKAGVIDAVGDGVIRVFVFDIEGADDGTFDVFVDALIGDLDGRRGIVLIVDIDGEELSDRLAAAVGGGDEEVDARGFFKIETGVGFEAEDPAAAFKSIVRYGEVMAVVEIGIGDAEAADDGAGLVFIHRGVAEGDVGGGVVDLGEGDRHL